MLWLCITMTKSVINYLTYKTKNCCCTVAANFASVVSALCNHFIWHSIALIVFWQPFDCLHVLQPLSLHCSVIIHIIRCFCKNHFFPGGMAVSEWMRSFRAVTDVWVANYSAPGTNTMRRIAYHPWIAVLPFLLTLSVSYCKRTLWRCGQLWPYVGMGSIGTSEKWKSVRKPHANLPDTPVAFTTASMFF